MAAKNVRPALLFLVLGGIAACGSAPPQNPRDVADANDTGRILPASSPGEQSILKEVGQLPPGTPQTFGDSVVVAEPIYSAASDRSCRALHITRDSGKQVRQRLTCSDGNGWFFVPDVLGLEASEASPERP